MRVKAGRIRRVFGGLRRTDGGVDVGHTTRVGTTFAGTSSASTLVFRDSHPTSLQCHDTAVFGDKLYLQCCG